MRRLVPAVILAIIVVGFILSELGNTAVSVEDEAGLKTEVTANVTQASNSSASATITITMYAVADE